MNELIGRPGQEPEIVAGLIKGRMDLLRGCAPRPGVGTVGAGVCCCSQRHASPAVAVCTNGQDHGVRGEAARAERGAADAAHLLAPAAGRAPPGRRGAAAPRGAGAQQDRDAPDRQRQHAAGTADAASRVRPTGSTLTTGHPAAYVGVGRPAQEVVFASHDFIDIMALDCTRTTATIQVSALKTYQFEVEVGRRQCSRYLPPPRPG